MQWVVVVLINCPLGLMLVCERVREFTDTDIVTAVCRLFSCILMSYSPSLAARNDMA